MMSCAAISAVQGTGLSPPFPRLCPLDLTLGCFCPRGSRHDAYRRRLFFYFLSSLSAVQDSSTGTMLSHRTDTHKIPAHCCIAEASFFGADQQLSMVHLHCVGIECCDGLLICCDRPTSNAGMSPFKEARCLSSCWHQLPSLWFSTSIKLLTCYRVRWRFVWCPYVLCSAASQPLPEPDCSGGSRWHLRHSLQIQHPDLEQHTSGFRPVLVSNLFTVKLDHTASRALLLACCIPG